MLITRIELQNARSYRDQTVAFAQGTNAICGENGAGKSTLLAAIGFALFNHLPSAHADFVREGERTATIGVDFVSSADGRTYQVVRKCGGSSEYYVYDPELKARLVSGRVDVLEWLKEQLGVDPSTDLTGLFRDAIGVPQGLLAAAFQMSPSQRKPTFDRLLQVDEYERVYKELRETLDYLRTTISDTEKQVAVLQTRVARLPALCDQAHQLRLDVHATEDRLAEMDAELSAVSARRAELAAARRALDELATTVRQQTMQLEGLTDQLAAARQAACQAEAAQAAIEASRPGYEAYGAARQALDRLEEERRQRDRHREQLINHERRRDLILAEVERLTAELDQATRAAVQMAALAPQVARQTQLEHELQQLRERLQALHIRQSQAADQEAALSQAQARLVTIERDLATARQLDETLAAARVRLAEMREAKLAIASHQAALRAEAERLKKQSGTLETTETASCPVCEQPLSEHHRQELLARNQAQIESLRTEYRALRQQDAEAAEREKAAAATGADVEARLRRLPRPAERDELLSHIAQLETQLDTARGQLAQALADEQPRAAALEQELAGLGNPRREHDRLASQAAQEARLELRLAEQRHALRDAESALAASKEQQRAYDGLDEQLDARRAELRRHQANHQRYLESARLAEQLPAHRQRMVDLSARQAALSEQLAATRSQLAEQADGFDAEQLAAMTEQEENLKREHARRQGRLGVLQQQLAGLESEIEQLDDDAITLTAVEVELAGHRQLRSTVDFLRDVIRSAGPHMIRHMVQRVSMQASRLFGSIMADHTARLHWQEDYGIALETDGRWRDFEQLSGGEQTAAALAVRLALLRELSDVDIAFFDEPTSNLDRTRRDNLAEQILAVKDAGFSQLFVISHDDTFEQVTDHVVRVRKERGESIVEVG